MISQYAIVDVGCSERYECDIYYSVVTDLHVQECFFKGQWANSVESVNSR